MIGAVNMKAQLELLLKNGFPSLQEPMPRGDMPGDVIFYSVDAFDKAETLYRQLVTQIPFDTQDKWVISISGGSGSGKTTLGSILAFYFNQAGVASYILSGDNYPNRIPQYNDAERLQRYRQAGQKAVVQKGLYTNEVKESLLNIYASEQDGQSDLINEEWYQVYHQAGYKALAEYLASEEELDFSSINQVIQAFKAGKANIPLKRMGRTLDALWYDTIDFSRHQIMIVEWTHGNHPLLNSVDVRVFLNSTPQETLEYRKLRARDGQVDSAFVSMVLAIEQDKLHHQAELADIILSKDGQILSYQDYTKLMEGSY